MKAWKHVSMLLQILIRKHQDREVGAENCA